MYKIKINKNPSLSIIIWPKVRRYIIIFKVIHSGHNFNFLYAIITRVYNGERRFLYIEGGNRKDNYW